jgi:hypothetical protein
LAVVTASAPHCAFTVRTNGRSAFALTFTNVAERRQPAARLFITEYSIYWAVLEAASGRSPQTSAKAAKERME